MEDSMPTAGQTADSSEGKEDIRSVIPFNPAKGPSKNTILAAIVIVFLIILAGVVLSSSSVSADVPRNGEYIEYSIAAEISGQTYNGEMRMEIQNVTNSSFNLIMTTTLAGNTQTRDMFIDYSGSDWIGELSNSTSAGVSAPLPGSTPMDQEMLDTVYGEKLTNHYVMDESGFSYEYWVGAANGCPYKLAFSYGSTYSMTVTLTGTNIPTLR